MNKYELLYRFLMLFALLAHNICGLAYDNMEQDGLVYGNFYYNSGNSFGLIDLVGYTNVPDDLKIPSFVEYKYNISKRNCFVRTIGENAFKNCANLKSVWIPSDYINSSAFENCTSLHTVTFGGKSISSKAFSGCTTLDSIFWDGGVAPYIEDDSFEESTIQNAIVYIPWNRVNSFKNNERWSKFEHLRTLYHQAQISVVGNGSVNVNYNGKTITLGYENYVEEGGYAVVTIVPNYGYHLENLTVGGVDVTSQVVGNQFVIDEVSENMDIVASFAYTSNTIEISVSGNGYVVCGEKQIEGVTGHVNYIERNQRDESVEYNVREGFHLLFWICPDEGYQISKVTENGVDITSQITDPIDSRDVCINAKMEISFEEIPPITHNVLLKAIGNGAISYKGDSIRDSSCSYGVVDGDTVVLQIFPDEGYRIKSVKLSNIDVSSSVSDNRMNICNVVEDMSLEVEFEAIPYMLSIKATGSGTATYNGTAIRSKTSSFIVTYGSSAIVSFIPDDGYRLKSAKLNSVDVTSNIIDNHYTISNICSDTLLEVEFEEIPPTFYSVHIEASGNGSITYGTITIRNQSHSFPVQEGDNISLVFAPDNGYRIGTIKMNDEDVTARIVNNVLSINNVSSGIIIEANFEAIPPTIYSLTVKSSGNGAVLYDDNVIRNNSSSFSVVEGTSLGVVMIPDEGCRVKSVVVNSVDVTGAVVANQYAINIISKDILIEVTFETVTYSLSIKATGNGCATYNGTTIRDNTTLFNVAHGSSATVSFASDDGYRIKSVKLNHIDVTSGVENFRYTINKMDADVSLEVEFEEMPPTVYALNVVASGNGTVSYDGNTIRNQSRNYSIIEGSTIVLSISPDSGYRIAQVLVNNQDATASISDNLLTVTNVSSDVIVEVSFEEIPPTTYTLTIVASGNGLASYNGTSIRSGSESFTVVEGTNAAIVLVPDNGHRVKSLKVDGEDRTANVANNQYVVSRMAKNTSVQVEFEEIPPTTFTLTIVATGNGFAEYDGTTIRDRSEDFTMVAGSSATVTFTPDAGHRIKSVRLNEAYVTENITNMSYTVRNIIADMVLEVVFVEDITEMANAGVNYKVVSYEQQTVNVATGNYGQVLTVPATFTEKGTEWKVVGVEVGALAGNTELAAIIWNAEARFNGSVSNPNLLLYVKSAEYAPTDVQNIIVDGIAELIVLTDAANGNNFYCPRAFTAKSVSYEHAYSMITGYNTSQGWETLVLPFDVTKVMRQSETELVPYEAWTVGSSLRPFWLYSLTELGWKAETAIAANTPYLISMPNNENYNPIYNVSGNIQFVGSNVQVKASENLPVGKSGSKKLVPNYQYQETSSDIYALNVSNLWSQETGGEVEGGAFIRSLRPVHPFEAYMTVEGAAASRNSIPVFGEEDATGICNHTPNSSLKGEEGVVCYAPDGRRLHGKPTKKGVYLVKGRKVLVK